MSELDPELDDVDYETRIVDLATEVHEILRSQETDIDDVSLDAVVDIITENIGARLPEDYPVSVDRYCLVDLPVHINGRLEKETDWRNRLKTKARYKVAADVLSRIQNAETASRQVAN